MNRIQEKCISSQFLAAPGDSHCRASPSIGRCVRRAAPLPLHRAAAPLIVQERVRSAASRLRERLTRPTFTPGEVDNNRGGDPTPGRWTVVGGSLRDPLLYRLPICVLCWLPVRWAAERGDEQWGFHHAGLLLYSTSTALRTRHQEIAHRRTPQPSAVGLLSGGLKPQERSWRPPWKRDLDVRFLCLSIICLAVLPEIS